MIGLWVGLLVCLGSLSVQAQSLEQPIETLESSVSKMTEDLPSWVKRFKFKGDLRLRYQYEETSGRDERHRGRLRYRLNVTARVTDQLKTIFGLASGGSDPRSTNQGDEHETCKIPDKQRFRKS